MASNRRSPTQPGLGFDYDEGHQEQSITALAGIPVLVQAFRSLGLPGSVKRNVSVQQRERGYDEASYVESFVILNAAGGECLDDFAHLRKDAAGELVGHELPSPEAACKFLYQFHDAVVFGANAAWLRMSILSHNLMTALKRMALPEEYGTARPKRLRFPIFTIRLAGSCTMRVGWYAASRPKAGAGGWN